jgi:spore coat polysaccharide biosynthesis protein SpsF
MDNPIPPSCQIADLVINALPHPDYLGYKDVDPGNRLEGLEYFILDERLEQLQKQQRQTNINVERILVAMGGGDEHNITLRVLEALKLAEFKGYMDVVLGSANPHLESIEEFFANATMEGEVNQSVNDLPDRIFAADIGFTAIGLTTYEMAALQLPVFIINGNELNNQVAKIYAFENPLGYNLGASSELMVDEIARSFKEVSTNHIKTAGEFIRTQNKTNKLRVGAKSVDIISNIISIIKNDKNKFL